MADNYDDIRGMQFVYKNEWHEIECFVAAIDSKKGITIKVLDIDEMGRMGYDTEKGTKNEGNIACIDLCKFPDDLKIFNTYVKHLRWINKGYRKKLYVYRANKEGGYTDPSFPSNPSCAF